MSMTLWLSVSYLDVCLIIISDLTDPISVGIQGTALILDCEKQVTRQRQC